MSMTSFTLSLTNATFHGLGPTGMDLGGAERFFAFCYIGTYMSIGTQDCGHEARRASVSVVSGLHAFGTPLKLRGRRR
eukprot:scaffold4265_cov105-Isochrysis_galbana.AAC.3